MTRTPDDLVRMEVHYCVSSLVSTLAGGYGEIITPKGARSDDLGDMIEQAFELACPIDDWEEAALQDGWGQLDDGTWTRATDEGADEAPYCDTAREACEHDNLEPYQREVFEHWIVSDWLAGKLAEHGEKVDTDFAGLTVWARTTSGQGIAMDSVIQRICADLNGEA